MPSPAITLAELAAGPHLASTGSEGARRQARLQQVEAAFAPLPFDAAAARSYGQIVAAVAESGRSPRRRVADLLVAVTAHANGLALYTRNPVARSAVIRTRSWRRACAINSRSKGSRWIGGRSVALSLSAVSGADEDEEHLTVL